jgi:hypothetical protein
MKMNLLYNTKISTKILERSQFFSSKEVCFFFGTIIMPLILTRLAEISVLVKRIEECLIEDYRSGGGMKKGGD